MKALLPLISAISLLIVAGAMTERYGLFGAIGALVCVVAAIWLLRDRDRQLATREEDELLDILNALAPRPHEGGTPR
jgi:positive regulator of sigma E activity